MDVVEPNFSTPEDEDKKPSFGSFDQEKTMQRLRRFPSVAGLLAVPVDEA